MEWFINAAKPFKGLEINVLSETIPTHEYESKTLTKAFEEITGIKVNHQLLGEGEVVQAVQTQMQTNRNLYDAYINDSDLIGTHSRLQSAVNLTDWMAGEGKDVTNPDARRQGLHRHLVHHRPRRQDLAAARPAVRQPVLVPQGLVRPGRPEEEVQGQVRLRPRRAGELERLRGHRPVLLGRRQGDRRQAHLRPHGLRQARARPRLAHDRRLAVDGRRQQQGPAQRPADRRVGHPHGGGLVQPAGRLGDARRRDQRPGLGLRDRQVGRVAAQVRAARCGRLRLLPVAAGAGAGQRRAADLLVHRVHRVDGRAQEGRQQHGRRQGHAAVAHGAVARRARTGRTA